MNTPVTEESKRFRRELLAAAVRDGGLQDLMAQGLEHHGPRVIAIIACTNTDPGRTLLRSLGRVPGACVQWQRDVREALAVHRAASIVVPADTFMPIADACASGLAAELQRMPAGPGIVPVVVLGANGAMTAFAGLPSGDGTLSDAFGQALKLRVDRATAAAPAADARQRRAERRRRYGNN
jgi:hypothetical protein